MSDEPNITWAAADPAEGVRRTRRWDLSRSRTSVRRRTAGTVKYVAAAEDRSIRTTRACSIAATNPAPNPLCRLRRAGRTAGASSIAILLALTVGVLAGCAATPGTVAVSKAGAVAFAHAVNLRASDQPSMEVVGPERVLPNPTRSEFARCDGGVSPARTLFNIRSTLLSTGDERERRLVVSRVTVMPSEALARRNLAAAASPRGLRCALRYGGTSISRLNIALPGGAHAFGQRIVVPSGGSTRVVGYHDVIGFVCGPAEIVLTAAGFSHPVPAQTEQQLLGVLYHRAAEARSEL